MRVNLVGLILVSFFFSAKVYTASSDAGSSSWSPFTSGNPFPLSHGSLSSTTDQSHGTPYTSTIQPNPTSPLNLIRKHVSSDSELFSKVASGIFDAEDLASEYPPIDYHIKHSSLACIAVQLNNFQLLNMVDVTALLHVLNEIDDFTIPEYRLLYAIWMDSHCNQHDVIFSLTNAITHKCKMTLLYWINLSPKWNFVIKMLKIKLQEIVGANDLSSTMFLIELLPLDHQFIFSLTILAIQNDHSQLLYSLLMFQVSLLPPNLGDTLNPISLTSQSLVSLPLTNITNTANQISNEPNLTPHHHFLSSNYHQHAHPSEMTEAAMVLPFLSIPESMTMHTVTGGNSEYSLHSNPQSNKLSNNKQMILLNQMPQMFESGVIHGAISSIQILIELSLQVLHSSQPVFQAMNFCAQQQNLDVLQTIVYHLLKYHPLRDVCNKILEYIEKSIISRDIPLLTSYLEVFKCFNLDTQNYIRYKNIFFEACHSFRYAVLRIMMEKTRREYLKLILDECISQLVIHTATKERINMIIFLFQTLENYFFEIVTAAEFAIYHMFNFNQPTLELYNLIVGKIRNISTSNLRIVGLRNAVRTSIIHKNTAMIPTILTSSTVLITPEEVTRLVESAIQESVLHNQRSIFESIIDFLENRTFKHILDNYDVFSAALVPAVRIENEPFLMRISGLLEPLRTNFKKTENVGAAVVQAAEKQNPGIFGFLLKLAQKHKLNVEAYVATALEKSIGNPPLFKKILETSFPVKIKNHPPQIITAVVNIFEKAVEYLMLDIIKIIITLSPLKQLLRSISTAVKSFASHDQYDILGHLIDCVHRRMNVINFVVDGIIEASRFGSLKSIDILINWSLSHNYTSVFEIALNRAIPFVVNIHGMNQDFVKKILESLIKPLWNKTGLFAAGLSMAIELGKERLSFGSMLLLMRAARFHPLIVKDQPILRKSYARSNFHYLKKVILEENIKFRELPHLLKSWMKECLADGNLEDFQLLSAISSYHGKNPDDCVDGDFLTEKFCSIFGHESGGFSSLIPQSIDSASTLSPSSNLSPPETLRSTHFEIIGSEPENSNELLMNEEEFEEIYYKIMLDFSRILKIENLDTVARHNSLELKEIIRWPISDARCLNHLFSNLSSEYLLEEQQNLAHLYQNLDEILHKPSQKSPPNWETVNRALELRLAQLNAAQLSQFRENQLEYQKNAQFRIIKKLSLQYRNYDFNKFTDIFASQPYLPSEETQKDGYVHVNKTEPSEDESKSNSSVESIKTNSNGSQTNHLSNMKSPRSDDSLELNSDICAVCLFPLENSPYLPLVSLDCKSRNDGNKSSGIKRVFHTFHQECIENWLIRKLDCPLCKHSFSTDLDQTP